MSFIKNVRVSKFQIRLVQDSVQVFEFIPNPKLHFGEAVQTTIAYTKYADCGTAEIEFEKLVQVYRENLRK